MQPRRGRGHRTRLVLAGIDGLVAAQIFFRICPLDVGRQGDVPCGGKGLGKVPVPGQTHTPMPEFARFQHGHADARAKFKLFTITNAAAGAYEPLNLGT